MSSIIEEILEKLARYPEAPVEHDDSSVTYRPPGPDGFVVRLTVERFPGGERYVVHYNGSHEQFYHRGTAMKAFGFGLSTGCRLREYSRSGRAYRWVVEVWDWQKHRWDADWDVVRWFTSLVQFWRRPSIRFLQNRLIDLGDSAYAR
jgi:hypothetical protein